MREFGLLFVGLIGLAAPAAGQDVLDDPGAAGALIAGACVTDTLDFEEAFASARSAVAEAGITVVTDEEKLAIFGDQAGTHLVIVRRIDSLACTLRVPAPNGSVAYYQALLEAMEAGIGAVYPKALSVESNLPSPHEEKHEWVYHVTAERHFAATLQWQVEDGAFLGIGNSQIYD